MKSKRGHYYIRKKVLYLGQLYPYPPDGGGKIKALGTLKALARHFDVFAVFVSEENPTKADLRQLEKMGIKVKVFYKSQILEPVNRNLIKMITKYFNHVPHVAYKYYFSDVHSFIGNKIKSFKPDAVHVCHIAMSQYLPDKPPKTRYFLELENIESHLQWTRFKYTKNIIRKVYVLIEGLVSFVFEKNKLKLFDHIFAICREDKNILVQIFKCFNITVQPPVMTHNGYQAGDGRGKDVLFVGDLRWPPNEDAIVWFLREIYPLVLLKIPDINIHIVGNYSSRNFFKWKILTGVKYYGFQNTLNPFFKNKPVFILPFRMGGGVKMKALTAFASGLPVVSTPMGVRGYAVVNNRECLIATNKYDFAENMIKAVTNRRLAMVLSENARDYVKAFHGRKQIIQFIKYYRKIITQ